MINADAAFLQRRTKHSPYAAASRGIVAALFSLACMLATVSIANAQEEDCLEWANFSLGVVDSDPGAFCQAVASAYAANYDGFFSVVSTSPSLSGSPTYMDESLTCASVYQYADCTVNCDVSLNNGGAGWPEPSCNYRVVANALRPDHNHVGDPIDPSIGNVTKVETDGAFAGASQALKFERYYNSLDNLGTDMGPGWRHSYDRSISVVYAPVGAEQVLQITSPSYSDPATACSTGFAAIQSRVNGWQNSSTSYQGGVCELITPGQPTTTIPIYSLYPYVLSSTQTSILEYDVIRDDGTVYRFPVLNGTILHFPGVSLQFTVTGSGFTVTDDEDNVETYSSSGVLKSITSRAGVVQTLSYSSQQLTGVTDSFGNSLAIARSGTTISGVTFSNGGSVSYAYDSSNRLSSVTNLDGTTLTFTYGNSVLPFELTAELDESNSQYVTWGYDSQGRAISSSLAGGAFSTTLSYTSNTSVTVTDALGEARTFNYTRVGDANKSTEISGGSCPGCIDSASTTYDVNGWVASRTDYDGNLTCYQNDPTRGLELIRVEGFSSGSTCPASLSGYVPASGTLQRVIMTQWSSSWREPQTITEPTRTTSFTFDDSGNILTKTITDTTVSPNVARTWTFTYNGLGQVLTAQDPRGNTTSYAYYSCTGGAQCGQVQTVTNALTQVTTFNTYNSYGQPLTITDPNGVVTRLTYDARERIASRQVGSETTGYSYYPTGLLKQVTLPDSTTIGYSYDNAHRLTQITDGAGNYITYTLDALGNHTATSSYDPTGVLHRTHSSVFNALSELYQDINAAGGSGVTTTYGYDANGNQTGIGAPLGRNTANAYDALNRLGQVTDPNSGVTQIGYDSADNVASVKDPRNLTTNYAHDGFNELIQLASPDTGTTSYTYDSAGNLKTATDARAALATYSYDGLNRLTQMAYSDDTINLTYDAGSNGIGRLTGANDSNVAVAWSYDGLGRVIGKGQTLAAGGLAVGYAYTNGDLSALVTPSGQTIVYSYTNHQITSISVNGTTLLSGVTYDPFGPVTGWTWGNSTSVSRAYDEDGNPSQIISAGVTNSYTVDNASRITGITDSGLSSNNWTFGYDLLDRVTSASSSALSRGYTYDTNGNTLTETGTVAYAATISSTSNQIASSTGGLARTYGYDAAGNTTSYGGNSYTFSQRGRMVSASATGGTTNYIYNALGQLVEKSGNGGTSILMYDEAGHIIGEYTSTGALIEETVWMGDTPVATIQPSGSSVAIYYVHTDHLNTVRKITRPSDNGLMWRWDPDTFGSIPPNTNPAGLGTFSYNLGFPGQYYLPETGLYVNYFRDYDPQTGRYIESDPIGLRGGSYSTYTYVGNNPVSYKDPFGLAPGDPFPSVQAAAVDALNWVYQIHPTANTEYAGTIYMGSNGNYYATNPNPGSESDVQPSYGPGGYGGVQAYYHTHGQCLKNFDNDHFSTGYPQSDLEQADWHLPNGVPSFLETPGHIILRYDPDPKRNQNGPITPIQAGKACPCNG